jgi:N-acetylmuramoyl-L-alanine amidase
VKIQTLNGVEVEERISPNSTMRPTKESVSVLVLHADDDTDEAESLSWVSSPASKVSYHFIVGRRGKAYLITHLDRVAYAVGVSEFPQATIVGKKSGKPGINTRSISISFANRNDGIEPYTDEQYSIGAKLAAFIMRRFPMISIARITTHAIVARPVGRKTDPKAFDLDRFKNLVREELTKC